MELNRNLSKEQIQSTIKYFKICSTCLTTRKMQIKVTLRLPLTAVKMTIIRNTDNYKFQHVWEEMGTLFLFLFMSQKGNGNSYMLLVRG